MEYGAEPTKEYGAEPTREYASAPVSKQPYAYGEAVTPTAPFVDDHPTTVVDGYGAPADRGFAEPLNPRGADPVYQPQKPQKKPSADYQDSFEMQNRPRFTDSGWQDHSQSRKKQYRRTTAGRKAASFFVCLLALLFGFLSLMIASSRIAFSERNIRRAYQKGTLADLTIDTQDGEKTLAKLITENVVDSKTNMIIPLSESDVEEFLKSALVNNFTENLVVDFTQFFIFGREPSLLNGDAIADFMSSISQNIEDEIYYSMSDEDIQSIGERVDGGDLSFLSIDKNGGYFKQEYGVDPVMISSLFSVWSLIICTGLTLLCIILVFLINHGNLPAGLSSNGTAMIVFGVLNTMIAGSLLILSYVKKIFLISELLRGFAFAMGAVSVVVLLVGIVFAVVKTVLKNRI